MHIYSLNILESIIECRNKSFDVFLEQAFGYNHFLFYFFEIAMWIQKKYE